MKIGIITLNSAHNFGASLQLYALQRTLEKLDFEVKVINYRYKKIDNIYNPYKRSKKGKLDYKFHLSKIKLHILDKYKIRKYENYEKFFKKYFNLTKAYETFKDLTNEDWNKKWGFDAYICGSDQIWNSHITRGLQPAYFLDFLPNSYEKDSKFKKISYAASLGTDKINKFDIPVFRQYLHDFDNISIREKSSVQSLKECTEKDIEVTVDPTLLLEKSDYDKVRNPIPNLKNREFIFVYVIDYNKELYKIAESISQEKNLPIVFSSPYLKPKKEFKNQISEVWDAGPGEFLELIAKAKYVVTNSYHGNIFSIIYKKKFISAPHHITSTRVLELTNQLNLDNVVYMNFNKFSSIDDIEIDYDEVEKKITELKTHSIDFLKKAIENNEKNKETEEEKIKTKDNFFINEKNKFTCYGCFACKETCPNSSITMLEDGEGFLYPKIDENNCINCNSCKKICIYQKKELIENIEEEYPHTYAAYSKNKDIRKQSSSGGIFLHLAQKTLDSGGYVVGVGYDKDMNAKYMIENSLEEIKKFSGSKYLRADINNIFKKTKDLLDNGEKVLFTGVPCILAGFKAYLKLNDNIGRSNINKNINKDIDEKNKYNENLKLVEILCHSNPSPKVFKKYVEYLENKFNTKIIDFKFKNKLKGWNSPSVEIIFENGKKIVESGKYNNYNRGFQISLMARPSCYSCEFIKEKRVGDITIGDFWGIEKFNKAWNDNIGVSLIMTNNKKGELILNEVKNSLNIESKELNEAFLKNHDWHIIMNRNRNEFFSKLEKKNINDLLYSYNLPKQSYDNKKNKE